MTVTVIVIVIVMVRRMDSSFDCIVLHSTAHMCNYCAPSKDLSTGLERLNQLGEWQRVRCSVADITAQLVLRLAWTPEKCKTDDGIVVCCAGAVNERGRESLSDVTLY